MNFRRCACVWSISNRIVEQFTVRVMSRSVEIGGILSGGMCRMALLCVRNGLWSAVRTDKCGVSVSSRLTNAW